MEIQGTGTGSVLPPIGTPTMGAELSSWLDALVPRLANPFEGLLREGAGALPAEATTPLDLLLFRPEVSAASMAGWLDGLLGSGAVTDLVGFLWGAVDTLYESCERVDDYQASLRSDNAAGTVRRQAGDEDAMREQLRSLRQEDLEKALRGMQRERDGERRERHGHQELRAAVASGLVAYVLAPGVGASMPGTQRATLTEAHADERLARDMRMTERGRASRLDLKP